MPRDEKCRILDAKLLILFAFEVGSFFFFEKLIFLLKISQKPNQKAAEQEILEMAIHLYVFCKNGCQILVNSEKFVFLPEKIKKSYQRIICFEC